MTKDEEIGIEHGYKVAEALGDHDAWVIGCKIPRTKKNMDYLTGFFKGKNLIQRERDAETHNEV